MWALGVAASRGGGVRLRGHSVGNRDFGLVGTKGTNKLLRPDSRRGQKGKRQKNRRGQGQDQAGQGKGRAAAAGQGQSCAAAGQGQSEGPADNEGKEG